MRWLSRSWVRLLVAVAPIAALLIAISVIAAWLEVEGFGIPLISAAGTLALYLLYVRWIERRPVDELGGAGAASELGRGAALGALLFAATVAVLCVLGTCTIAPGDGGLGVLQVLGGSVAAAVTEEILLRAILFRITEQSLGTPIALALSAVVFGLLHALNPGATPISTLAIALEARVLLAAAFVLTRRLWLPFGLHAAWNFIEGGVFGAAISGSQGRGLLATRFHGEPLITGGAFGPEASIIAVVICLAAGIAVLVVVHRRGHFVPAFWRR